MTEPVTVNKSFIVPNTTDLPGAWGTSALNPNFQTLDALTGGTTTISLSGATTLFLTVPATTGIWPSSLSQSVNSIIFFTGAQSGNAIVGVTLPGYYIVHNKCTGTSYVQLAPAAASAITGGNRIGAPPGKKCHVFFDGTDMDYVNMPDPGTAYDLHTNTTSLPPWMVACTVSPYLVKNGLTYSTAAFPALSQLLGSTFGGNGITTFGVPDENARFRLAVDASSVNRVTSLSGVNGSTFGSAGGNQLLQSHTHANVLTDLGHTHAQGLVAGAGSVNIGGTGSGGSITNTGSNNSTPMSLTNANVGTGTSQNMPPTIVSFLALIKT